MCNHAIGFCRFIDFLIYIKDTDGRKEYLTDKCSYSSLDIIFDYCPLCGEGLKYLMLKKGVDR